MHANDKYIKLCIILHFYWSNNKIVLMNLLTCFFNAGQKPEFDVACSCMYIFYNIFKTDHLNNLNTQCNLVCKIVFFCS